MNKRFLACLMLFTMFFSTISLATEDVTTPTATPQNLTVEKNSTLTGTLSGTAEEGKTLTYSIVTEPSHGTVTIDDSSTGEFSYEPEENYVGEDSFTFKVNDGTTDSNPATITITIEEIATTITAQDLNLTLEKNTILTSNLSGSAEEGKTLTYIIVTEPSHGTLVHDDESSASFSYTPETDYVGSDSFTYKVNDGTNDSNVATVTLTIEEPKGEVIPFNYRDMQKHWANYSASSLAARGYIIGEEIGNNYYFYPEREMTRADFMLFLLAITESDEDANLEIPNVTFADSDSIPDWLLESAKLAYAKGIIKGSAIGNSIYLNPYDKLSRAQAVVMINNVLKPANSTEDLTYKDKDIIPGWGIQAVKNLTAYKIVQGNADNTFNPNSNVTRAQAAELSFKMLKQIEKDGLENNENVK